MSRDQLIADELAWKEKNKQIKEWLLTHPLRVQSGMWSASINLTEVLGNEFEVEMKNARRSGRTSLRTRLKHLVTSIIARLKSEVPLR